MVIAQRTQTLVQLTDDLVEKLDKISAYQKKSRSAVIRDAVEAHIAHHRELEIDRQIIEAYTKYPQTEEIEEWDGPGPDELPHDAG